ncbi:DUF4190 domain-containing protein [Streptomyces sp. NPDC092952]|uniref:DUF4190 domain-containing protein n=1 Tax=Streptomyces sp. NPDC092952 TaxID=3366018 RepID=UPI003804F740
MNAQGIETPPNRTAPQRAPLAGARTAPAGTGPGPARNGLATAAMALGIVGLLTSVVLVGGPLAVFGLILGIAALMTARRTGTGRGRALTALVTSALAIAVSGLVAVLLAWYANHTQACYQPDTLSQYAQCVREQLAAD